MRVKSAKGQLSKNDNMEVDSSVKSIEKDNVSIQENSSVSSSLLTAMLIGSIPSFQMGFAIGVLNPLTLIASSDLDCSPTDMMGWPLIVSCFCPAGLLGSAVLAAPTMKSGLVNSFFVSCVICIISNLLCGAAAFVPSHGFAMMLVGRIGLGIAAGMGTVVSPVYFGDISPPHLRGIIGASYQLATVGGILISQLLAVQMATPELYGWLLLSPTLVSLLQLLVAPLVLPESPVWLLANGMPAEASKVSMRLGLAHDTESQGGDVEGCRTFDSSINATTEPPQASLSLFQVMSDPKLAVALFMLLALQMGQQLSGIGALFFYSTDFFKLAGLANPTFGTLLAGAVNVVSVICILPLLMKTPRRKMLVVGLTGMLVSALILTSALLTLGDKEPTQAQKGIVVDDIIFAFLDSYIPYVCLTVVLTFIIFYELSIGLVPWIVAAELFPANSKDAAFSFASGANWFANFVVGIAFPAVQAGLGPYCFVPFIASIALSLFIVYHYLPETYGHSVKDNLDRLHTKFTSPIHVRCAI